MASSATPHATTTNLPRILNTLHDQDRNARKNALTMLAPIVRNSPNELATLALLQSLVHILDQDAVEKCRTLAADHLHALLQHAEPQHLTQLLPALMPLLVRRIGPAPDEPAEELRLALLSLLERVDASAPAALAAYAAETSHVLAGGFADPFPDMKRAACVLAAALAASQPRALEPHCLALARALAPCMVHQHSRVRAASLGALVELALLDPSVLGEMGPQLTKLVSDRAPAVRRRAVGDVSRLLAGVPSRRAHAPRLVTHLLVALSDEVEANRAAALSELNGLGERLRAATATAAGALTDDLEVAAAAASLADDAEAAEDAAAAAEDAAAAAAAAAAASSAAGCRRRRRRTRRLPLCGATSSRRCPASSRRSCAASCRRRSRSSASGRPRRASTAPPPSWAPSGSPAPPPTPSSTPCSRPSCT